MLIIDRFDVKSNNKDNMPLGITIQGLAMEK